ncbi:Ferredoxin-dependent glutamate synthase 1 [Thalassocella blandensis]|nr:Ferredoxin-dependent glutamate synthase 1 [Thalassocella blandensis]
MLIPNFTFTVIQVLAYSFVACIIIALIAIAFIYVLDRTQKRSTVRRNYPVIGRFRYLFEHLGTFFRQYFFAMDREELPFNRAERSWVYRAAKDVDTTVAFGSTRDLRPPGTIYFVNCAFPTLEVDSVDPSLVTIGPHVEHPYITSSLFNISGMSYGAISVPAVRALSLGAKKAGIWLNTGEGGLSSYHLEGGADLVFQIGTAKFGVRDALGQLDEARLAKIAAYPQVKMFELKLAQGAKPGKGGILPGAKVTSEIAEIRGIEVGKSAISPNRHPEINSVEDLMEYIQRIRRVAKKPVGFKTVVGDFSFFENLCEYIKNAGEEYAPDFITIDSADGGTGAAPMSLIDNMGMPIHESLPGVADILHKYDLKKRIKIIASGKLVNPSEVAWAFCAGADFVVSARGFMFALGCIQSLQCNKNTCPTGVATHDKKLQYGLVPENKAERVAAYAKNMQKEVGTIAHSCGVAEPRQLQRKHARMVLDNGTSISLQQLHPGR